MMRFFLFLTILFWFVGCEENGGPTTPGSVPNIAGTWSGTETVDLRGGSQCHPTVQNGSRTGNIFFITQNDQQIVILQLVNCHLCEFTGTITSNGSFIAEGSIPPATARLVGQVSGDRVTATKQRPSGVDCDFTASYDLTRN